MALCDNGVQTTRRPPGDSVSLEKALAPSLAAAEHRAAEGDLAGAVVPQTSPVASARRRLALPAGGKVVVAAAESVLEKAGEREVPAGRKERGTNTVAQGGKGGELELRCCKGSSQDQHPAPCSRCCHMATGHSSCRAQLLPPGTPVAPLVLPSETPRPQHRSPLWQGHNNPQQLPTPSTSTKRRPAEPSRTPLAWRTHGHARSRDQPPAATRQWPS